MRHCVFISSHERASGIVPPIQCTPATPVPRGTTPFRMRGFTLVETVIVIAMTVLISVTLGSLLVYFYKTNAYTLEQSTAVEQARRGVEDAMRNLREASYGSDGSYPIEIATSTLITFYANDDTDTQIERITYSLQNGRFYRIVQNPTGNPLSYAGAAPATSTIASSVTNGIATPVFQYYDNAGNLLPLPVNISKISSIKTTVIIDVNVNRAPVPFTLSGAATLRNLRTQL